MNSLIIVNKYNSLEKNYIPLDMEYINVDVDVADEKKFMRYIAVIHLRKMFMEAKLQGISLVGISAFRSYLRQQQLYTESLQKNGIEYTKKYIAYPGTSEHQTGFAIDISCKKINNKLKEEFADTKEGIWILNNCYKYGYIIRYPYGYERITGYNFEPWHIRYIGIQHSLNMNKHQIKTLEEYKQYLKTKSYGKY
mgnify:CR=1 FL=1